MGIRFPVHPPEPFQAALARLGADRDQLHPLQLLDPGVTEAAGQQLGGVVHRFAAAECDGIKAALFKGLQCPGGQARRTTGRVGGPLHHPGAGRGEGFRQQRAAAGRGCQATPRHGDACVRAMPAG